MAPIMAIITHFAQRYDARPAAFVPGGIGLIARKVEGAIPVGPALRAEIKEAGREAT